MGGVAAYSHQLSRGRSVGPYVRRSVGPSSALWKNSRSDPDVVWHHRSDGFRDEAGDWSMGRGTFGDEFGVMRPSCQITLVRLVIIIVIKTHSTGCIQC